MGHSQSDYRYQEQLIAALCDPSRYPHPADSVQLIETHISWVLLAGSYAYKIKKAINLGFLDYAGLEARRFFCEEEIRLNRRTAPNIYIDCVAIGGGLDDPKFDVQPPIEYAVRMHRFDPANLMDRMLTHNMVTPQHIDALAATIFRFHTGLPPTATKNSSFGTLQTIHAAALQNVEQLQQYFSDKEDSAYLGMLQRAVEAEFGVSRNAFETRRNLGFVRECHGDLHLGNIVLDGGNTIPFDCIEFNPDLRWIDVIDEIAFTVMDLQHRNHPELAWRLLNACLEMSGDYAGVSVLRFYLAYRAMVRAKVCAIRSAQADISEQAKSEELQACRGYMELAGQYLGQRSPALIITHGLPGSGKTTFSQLALQQLGVIRIRSDVERKRIFGLDAFASSHAHANDIYSPEATRRTYACLLDLARGILAAGYTVIVDAAFLSQDERQSFQQLAQAMSVPFAIASLQAADKVMRERIVQRHSDASEADVTVLDMLKTVQQPLSAAELACTVNFSTEEAPDSAANSHAWLGLEKLLHRAASR